MFKGAYLQTWRMMRVRNWSSQKVDVSHDVEESKHYVVHLTAMICLYPNWSTNVMVVAGEKKLNWSQSIDIDIE